MAGFAGTSNVLAGGMYDIPTFGTMAHSFVTAFNDEIDSYRAYAKSFPDTSTFLVDTYDTLEGTRNAIVVAREMREQGHELRAIRLDSGDLLDLALKTRAMLDDAGFQNVQVFASGGLDEFEVDALLKSAAPIDGFGIGTKVGVSADAPWTDCAYKLVQYDGRPVLKLSAAKETLPGPKQVFRYRGEGGRYLRDVVAGADEPIPSDGAEPLLHEVMRVGKPAASPPTLGGLHEHFKKEFACLPDEHKALRKPKAYEVIISESLLRLQSQVVERIRER
jgi:nicotinate phosphoribosyltransferase